jgi:hypothetical protein
VQAVEIATPPMMMFVIMATRDNEFEPRLGKPPADRAPKLKGVRAAVRQATRQPSASGPKPRQPSVRAHFAKGSAGRTRQPAVSARRVVVKMRYAANGGGRAAPLRAHVAYLSREGAQRGRSPEGAADSKSEDPTRSVDYLTREEAGGSIHFAFYDRASDVVDAKAITAGWSEDPRHFRMIVSAEDGEALGDLRPFIREVMAGLEAKLGTRLEWLAVDHHDTDNPHTHVLIRGRRPDGQDLFIPSRLISSGIREQAQEIVTRVLGPRLEVDLVQERFADISRMAVTPLDRELAAAARAGALMPTRPDLIARLERLEGWGLAERGTDGWRLDGGLAMRLRAMAVHEDVVRAVASVQPGREPRLVLEADRDTPVIGELVHLGPVDEIGDQFLAVVETGSGELRYARFERPQDLAVLAGAEPGAIVSFDPNVATVRASDTAVARIAASSGGIYSTRIHSELEPNVDQRLIAANVRRLEVMRRMGLVQRSGNGEFIVGRDHLANAMAFEERMVRRAPFSAQVASYWSLSEQVEARAPTHLDRVLVGDADGPSGEARIAREFEQALQQRRLFLIEQGWMTPHEAAPSRQAMQRLVQLELTNRARVLSGELGVPVLTYDAHRVSGVYARRIDLAQGRMALIVGDRQGNLVPWRPALERFAGRKVEGVMRGQGLSWTLSRGIGLGIG